MITLLLSVLAILYFIVGFYVVGGSGGFLRGFSLGTLFSDLRMALVFHL